MTPVLVVQVVTTGFTTTGFFFGAVVPLAANAGATPNASGLAVSAALTRQIRRLTTTSRFSGIGTIDSGVAGSPATWGLRAGRAGVQPGRRDNCLFGQSVDLAERGHGDALDISRQRHE